MNWNQPICEACWSRRCPGRIPVRIADASVETCAYCGLETDSGIFVREHPDSVPFPRQEDRT